MGHHVLSAEETSERAISIPESLPSHIQLKVISIDRLEIPYQPEDVHMAEDIETFQNWDAHLKANPLSEQRTWRRPVELLDPSQMQYTVKEGETCYLVDSDTNQMILLVVQKLVNDPSVLRVMDSAVVDQVNKTHQLIRVDDPGRMANVGYTPGMKSGGELSWGKSLKSNNTTSQAYATSSIFAHAWQHALKVLPQDVIEDFEEASERLGGLCMDAGKHGSEEKTLKYTMKIDGKVTYHEVSTLAPPQGAVAINYARFTHNEVNLNKYCVSHTTARTHPSDFGGNFYNSTHGVLVPGHADQLVCWAGLDFHGTTLAKVNPTDRKPSFQQSGLAFILSNLLHSSFKKTNKKRKAGELENEEDSESANTLTTVFNDLEVKAKLRAVMPLRKPHKVRDGTMVFQKDRKETFHLPAIHAYQKWTKAQMVANLETRMENGKPLKFSKTKSNPGMMYLLLKNDDVDVSVTYEDPPTAADRRLAQAGTDSIAVERNTGGDER